MDEYGGINISVIELTIFYDLGFLLSISALRIRILSWDKNLQSCPKRGRAKVMLDNHKFIGVEDLGGDHEPNSTLLLAPFAGWVYTDCRTDARIPHVVRRP